MKISQLSISATLTAILWLSPGLAAAQEPTVDEARTSLGEFAEAKRLQQADMTFDEFKASVFKEPGPQGKYIVNGDTPIANEKKLQEFFEENVKKKPAEPSGDVAELILHQPGGLDAVWSNSQKRRLTYCVSNTFAQNYTIVVAAMQAATQAWEAVSDVDFLHLGAEDSGCTASNSNVLFDVRPVNLGQYLAKGVLSRR